MDYKKIPSVKTSQKRNSPEKIFRLVKILNLIDSGKKATPKELAEGLGVTERSLYRYIEILIQAGFPIAPFDRKSERYTFIEGYSLKKLGLSASELETLLLLNEVASRLGTPFNQTYKTTLEKIALGVKNFLKNPPAAPLPWRIGLDGVEDFPQREKYLELITQAQKEKKRLGLRYQAYYSGEITERKVNPYGLYYDHHGFWTLIGYCNSKKAIRRFALEKILELKLLDETFDSVDFDLDEHLAKSWEYYDGPLTKVTLRFNKIVVPYILRKQKWHPSQKTTKLKNGGLQLEFTVAGTEEIRGWIYSWLPWVEVLQPKDLRQEILTDLKASLKAHQKK
jgi:predicted DNA-binding transcriptional regulator YafY